MVVTNVWALYVRSYTVPRPNTLLECRTSGLHRESRNMANRIRAGLRAPGMDRVVIRESPG
jgi:hypothetical protein